jgi:hypothetical protein
MCIGSKLVGVKVVVLCYKIIHYDILHFVGVVLYKSDFLFKCAVRICCGRKLFSDKSLLIELNYLQITLFITLYY